MASTDDLFSDSKFLDIYPYKYVLRQQDVQESVFIDLMSGNVSRERIIDNGTKKSSMGIKAVYGILELEKAKYLIVVTKSNLIGSVYSRKIFQATKFEFLPITPDRQIKEADKKYIEMLQELFNTKFFYFSDEYDLTSSFQQFICNEADKNRFNPAYCYNENCITQLIKIGAQEWICPFITGYINISYTQINDKDFDFILISRRDKRRVGLRFMSRGTDLDGNCSNMAEQESIIVLNNTLLDKDLVQIYSYVQTRGSMPFRWRQTPTLKWAPKGYITADDKINQILCKKHFGDQCQHYPKQTLLNLIDKKGTQKMLGTYFEKVATGLQNENVRYIWFDFHAECRKMKYENLSRLLDQVQKELNGFGYFHFQYQKQKPSEVEIHKKQIGVFRTNCMDCLDRTNVVQSVVARQILHKILNIAKLLPSPTGDPFQKFPEKLEETFRAVWTRNADVMSILYSGTGALKTDFTRTGKRTKQGALQDGKNSIHRYFLNNFYDAHKQNTYSLLLGKFKPSEQKYTKPAINPLFILLGVIFCGFMVLSKLSLKYVHPLFLEESQIQENIQAGTNVHGGISLSISEGIFLLTGLGLVLKLVQQFNGIFVPKPLLN